MRRDTTGDEAKDEDAREQELASFTLERSAADHRGAVGERNIARALGTADIPGRHHIWTNVLVPRGEGAISASEVDLIMLHAKGILVFESKNYGGWIFGDKDAPYWAQVMGKGERHTLVNPIRQNAVHVRDLARHLVVPEDHFLSYIVFSEQTRLDRLPARGTAYRVCGLSGLADLVRHDLERRADAFTGLALATLEERIEQLSQASTDEARATHARQVREAFTCPRCGGALVERTGPTGTFLGCASFPRCRYTRSLTSHG